jgi:signal transduction histidine kinase
MSQENDAYQPETWNWYADAQGRVTSVSSGFTTSLGTSAGKQIIGNFFWAFAENLEKPTSGWYELENCFKTHKKIKKFIFHYNSQGNKIKIAISGDPMYEKDTYIGHRGTGYFAHNDEVSIPEIAQNMAAMSLENLDLGIAIFSPEMGLIEFNNHFMTHMTGGHIKIMRNMPYKSIISYLKTKNKYYEDLSYELATHSCFYFSNSDKGFICIKKIQLPNNIIMLKTELDKKILNYINNYKQNISKLNNDNNVLELRIRDYKDKLAHFFDKKPFVSTQDTDLKKLLEFYTNNLDVGILITAPCGEIESANYYTAQMFGFTTVSMLLSSDDTCEFKKYLLERQKYSVDLLDNSLNRFEHNITLDNFMYQGEVKEVIIVYPSVHNPQKILSFFYPQNTQIVNSNNNSNNKSQRTETDDTSDSIYQEFIRYMVDDIKSSVNVIGGYNDLRNINKDTDQIEHYNKQISQSCNHILTSISDVMQVYKIASNMLHLEQSVISPEDLVFKCLQQFNTEILAKNIDLSFDIKNMGLFIISDKDLLYHALTRIFNCIIRSSSESSTLKIKIIDDIDNQKINIVIADESTLNITKISKADIDKIFNDTVIRSTGVLNLKIAEKYLKLLGCDIKVKSYEGLGNTLNIEISGDMVTSQHERDVNNFVV